MREPQSQSVYRLVLHPINPDGNEAEENPMSKHKNVPAITQSASLASRTLARLETAARAVHESETAKRERSMQLVSSRDGFSAVIRHGKTLIEIAGEDFAVTRTD